MRQVQAGMRLDASGSVAVVMWSYFEALTSFCSAYLEPMSFGAKVMDVVLRARGESLLLAIDLGLVHLPLLGKLRIRRANYTWQFLSHLLSNFLQPELQRFLYVRSSAQSLGARERARWGKYKQIRSGKAVCGELCLWWRKRKSNFHVPVPLVFMHVASVSCLRTMEQAFINLLTAELNAPWVRRLVKSKHSSGTKMDPVWAVRRQLVAWRQFSRYRRRVLRLAQVQPSVFRSQKVVGAIVLDLASDSLKSVLAQKLLRSNYVDADAAYHLYRVASQGDPFYETLLTEVLAFSTVAVAAAVCALVHALADAATTFRSDSPLCVGLMLECVGGSVGSLPHPYYESHCVHSSEDQRRAVQSHGCGSDVGVRWCSRAGGMDMLLCGHCQTTSRGAVG